MMKKILSYLTLLSIVCGAVSCKDFLETEPQSSMRPETVFSNPDLALKTVGGILQSFGETESYRGRYLTYYGINNDCEIYNSARSWTSAKANLSNYNTDPANSEMNKDVNAWAKMYEGIERANMAVSGIRAFGDIENSPEMAKVLGEVLTLRAVLYHDLIKAWGDVPARFEPVSPATINLPRADRDLIFKQLLADLDEAAGYVPWPNGDERRRSSEAINKSFIKGMRARIALHAGGYAQRLDGSVRRSNDPDLAPAKMYEIAKNECLEIIAQPGAGQLLGFEEQFRVQFCGEQLKAGLETLWELPFSETRGRVIFDLGVEHTTVDDYTGQAKGGANGPTPIMYYAYDQSDVRRDVTCVPFQWKDGKQVPAGLGKWYFGKYRYEWLPRRVTAPNDDGLNFIFMRYSDVLLMAAEAINELEGPSGANNAAQYLRRVRERAFPNDAAKVNDFMTAATANQTAFFDAIVDERALEFCGEMLRKADLIRWNLLNTKLSEAKANLQALRQRTGVYADVPMMIFWKVDPDDERGERILIYGMNPGENNQAADFPNFDSNMDWVLSASSGVYHEQALFVRNPDLQQYWPIWKVFVDNSNGMLNNNHLPEPINPQ